MKRTIKDICKLHGITADTIKAAKSKGVNHWNDDEMRDYLGTLRHRIKPGAELPPASPAVDAQTIAQMEAALKSARSIDEVKIIKEKLAGLQIAVRVQRETRELIPAGEAKQSTIKVISAARAEFLKLSSDLPPRLTGLNEGSIQKILREAIIEVLTRLSTETGGLYI